MPCKRTAPLGSGPVKAVVSMIGGISVGVAVAVGSGVWVAVSAAGSVGRGDAVAVGVAMTRSTAAVGTPVRPSGRT